MYGSKIRAFRVMRGLSQEDLASKLNIAQNSYSKIEGNKQKITHEMLEKIAKELGVTVADIVSPEPIIINNHASNQGTQGIGHIEHFYTDQKELYEKLIASKDEEIKLLKEMLDTVKKLLARFEK